MIGPGSDKKDISRKTADRTNAPCIWGSSVVVSLLVPIFGPTVVSWPFPVSAVPSWLVPGSGLVPGSWLVPGSGPSVLVRVVGNVGVESTSLWIRK